MSHYEKQRSIIEQNSQNFLCFGIHRKFSVNRFYLEFKRKKSQTASEGGSAMTETVFCVTG